MDSDEPGTRSPCQQVVEWRISQPDCSEIEAQKLQAISEEGITEELQAELLADACKASGMRDVCSERSGIEGSS